MDRFTQLEAAHALYLDLAIQVDHFEHAISMLGLGEFQEAAWAFWCAGMTKAEPGTAPDVMRPRRRRALVANQVPLFGATS